MNSKHYSLLAMAALLACGGARAQTSSVNLYGIIDVGVVALDGVDDKTRHLVSSGNQVSSRLGFRGTEEISTGWKAIFTLEHQLYADTGSISQSSPQSGFKIPNRALVGVPNTIRSQLEPQLQASLQASLQNKFWHRQAWVGVITPVGAVTVGRQYSPVYATFGKFDPHQAGNVGNAFAALTVPTGVEIRIDNSVAYTAEMSGFRFNAIVAAGEGDVGPGRFWGTSLQYAKGPLELGVAYQSRRTSEDLQSLQNLMVGGTYEWGDFKFFGEYLRVKDHHPQLGAQLRYALNTSTAIPAALKPAFLAYGSQIADALGFDGHLIYGGVHYMVTPRVKLVASYGSYNDKVDLRDVAIAGLAAEYIFSKRTSIWLSGGYVDNKTGQQVLPFSQSSLYGFTDKPGRDSSAVSLNIVHRF